MSIKKLVEGWQTFHSQVVPGQRAFFKRLVASQDPKVLFITCADSRLDPNLFLQTRPGELFINRNPGNLVPPLGADLGGAAATVEYSLTAISVDDIVICGHSDCGAMKGLVQPEALKTMPLVSAWLRYGEPARQVVETNYPRLSKRRRLEILAKENALAQVENLRTYPSVAAKLARRALRLHAWYYDIGSGQIEAYSPSRSCFVPLSESQEPAVASRPLAEAR